MRSQRWQAVDLGSSNRASPAADRVVRNISASNAHIDDPRIGVGLVQVWEWGHDERGIGDKCDSHVMTGML